MNVLFIILCCSSVLLCRTCRSLESNSWPSLSILLERRITHKRSGLDEYNASKRERTQEIERERCERERERERGRAREIEREHERERQRIGFQGSLMLDPGSIKGCNVPAHLNDCGYASALIENQSFISCRHSLSGCSVPIYTDACMSHKQTHTHTHKHTWVRG